MKIEPQVFHAFHTPDDPGIINTEPSLTQEHFADSCDINKIMGDYQYTGIMPEKPGAIYGDFTTAEDFRTALQTVVETQNNFLSMPPDVRSRFGNDPANFIAFCENSDNLPELHRMGFTSHEYNTRVASPGESTTPKSETKA